MTRKKPMAKNKDEYINYEKDANPDHRSISLSTSNGLSLNIER